MTAMYYITMEMSHNSHTISHSHQKEWSVREYNCYLSLYSHDTFENITNNCHGHILFSLRLKKNKKIYKYCIDKAILLLFFLWDLHLSFTNSTFGLTWYTFYQFVRHLEGGNVPWEVMFSPHQKVGFLVKNLFCLYSIFSSCMRAWLLVMYTYCFWVYMSLKYQCSS